MKKIAILRTGGTFDQVPQGEEKKISIPKRIDDLVSLEQFVGDIATIEEHFLELLRFKNVLGNLSKKFKYNLIDSSNMQPEHWVEIAHTCKRLIDKYDGIVILHGTDTLAYTASALCFMLQKVSKPIIITGSQKTLVKEDRKIRYDGDAIINLRDAVATATTNLPGVFVVFNRKIMKGCRVSKIRSKDYNAFESINYPLIGEIINDTVVIPFLKELSKSKGGEGRSLELYTDINPMVCVLKLTPGLNPRIFDAIRDIGYRGIIIEAYGLGGLPSYVEIDDESDIFPGVPFKKKEDWSLKEKIEELINDEIVVVIKSQCIYEGVLPGVYEVSNILNNPKVISGYDMTTEAIVTKLMWILGQMKEPYDLEEIRKKMYTNYCDEINVFLVNGG